MCTPGPDVPGSSPAGNEDRGRHAFTSFLPVRTGGNVRIPPPPQNPNGAVWRDCQVAWNVTASVDKGGLPAGWPSVSKSTSRTTGWGCVRQFYILFKREPSIGAVGGKTVSHR